MWRCEDVRRLRDDVRCKREEGRWKKELRPYAKANGIRTEPIVKGIAFKRPGRLDQFTYT